MDGFSLDFSNWSCFSAWEQSPLCLSSDIAFQTSVIIIPSLLRKCTWYGLRQRIFNDPWQQDGNFNESIQQDGTLMNPNSRTVTSLTPNSRTVPSDNEQDAFWQWPLAAGRTRRGSWEVLFYYQMENLLNERCSSREVTVVKRRNCWKM